MKVDRKKLIDILNKLRIGLSSKESIEQSTSFVFVEGEVVTFNDEVAASAVFDVGFDGAVPAQQFLAYLNRHKGESIEFQQTETTIKIKGRGKTTISCDKTINLPLDEIPLIEDDDWKSITKDFKEGLEICHFCVGKDITSPIITNVHVHDSVMIATDNVRIMKYDLDEAVEDEMLIPSAIVKHVSAYKCTKYFSEPGWIHFKNEEDVVISARTFEDKFPDYETHFEDIEGETITFPEDTIEAIETAEIFSAAQFDSDREIAVIFADGKMTIKGTSDLGSYEQSFDVKHESDFYFTIHPTVLKQALPLISSATVNEDVMLLVSKKYQHMICLSGE